MSVSTSKSSILHLPAPFRETLAARMARKRRAPSPPPPPPPQEESSSEESSSGEEEEEAEGIHATQKPPQNPKPPSTAAANDADSSDEEQESSDSEIDAEAFQLRHLARSPGKPSVVDSKLESDADEEEKEEEEEEEPYSVQKTAGKKLKSEAGKKRLAPEPTPSGKAKKAKTEVENKAPQPTPSGKAKKAKAGAETAAAELSPDGKGKKAEPGPSPSSKSEKRSQVKRWAIEDEIKILEAIVEHVKTKGTQPSAFDLIAAVGDSLDRKNCTKTEMYEKVRQFKQRYEITAKKVASTGTLPGKDDDLRKYKLSEAAWGENKMEVASASISQNDGVSLKSKKGQTNKEKMDDHSKGGTAKEASTTANENVGALTGSKNGESTKEKIDGDTKSRSSKKATTTDTPVKSKKRACHKDGLEEDAKTGTSKETATTATQNVGSLFSSKRESDKEKMDGDGLSLEPKEATQNGSALTESKNGETHKVGMDIDANVQDIRKGFAQLQNLYPNLTSYVESIKARHPCGETLKRAFEFIDDEKACTLESKIKKQRVAEVKMEISRADTKKEVANVLIGLLD